jgi:hypothetical protein
MVASRWLPLMLVLTTAATAATPRPSPIAESPCETSTLVDAAFRDAAIAAFDHLVIRAPGQSAHGAVRSHHAAGHLDPQGRAWQQVTAYAANLAMLGVLRVSPQSLPVAADWLRWQAGHMDVQGRLGGVVLDHWVRADGLEESLCPPGMAKQLCAQVDAFDSTAASTLLLADAYVRFGGDAALLREPAVRLALESAALALVRLAGPSGLTVAKPDYPVVYTMDAVEVVAGWRAWARLQRDVYAQPASANNSLVQAQRIETVMQTRLWNKTASAWRVSLDAGAPQFNRWYPDTMAQAWPLLWGHRNLAPERLKATWRSAIAPWQGKTPPDSNHWAQRNADGDGFWWPAVAVASLCAGDVASAQAWVARARQSWMNDAAPFAWPFQVSDLLWLLWLAEPVGPTPSTPPLTTSPKP